MNSMVNTNSSSCIGFFRYKKLWKHGAPLIYIIVKDFVSSNSVVYIGEANGQHYSVKAIRVKKRSIVSKIFKSGFECFSAVLERLKRKENSPFARRVKKYLNQEQDVFDRNSVIREIYILKAVQHRHVIRYYDYFEMNNFIWIVNELAFANLDRIRRAVEDDSNVRLIELELIYFLMAPIIDALAYIHEVGVIHMDIKEENILIMHDGSPKLTDFGLSKINPGIEVPSKGEGTDVYRAPEILIYDHPMVTPAVDVWSLGMTFQSLVFGDLKSSDLDFLTEIYRTTKDDRIRPHIGLERDRFPTDQDLEYLNFILKVMIFDPKSRLSSRALRQFDWVENMCQTWKRKTSEDIKEFDANMGLLQKRIDYINERR